MLLNEHSVGALDSCRRERFAQEREGVGLGRKSALALVIVGIVLAACGVPVSDDSAPSQLIVDLAPVGSPSISALRGYEFPEMFPTIVGQNVEIDGYEAPEMWPVATEREFVESSTGPR